MRFIHFRENRDSSRPSRELTIAYEVSTGEGDVIKVGLAYCSQADQFNRKIARKIAGGRCLKQRMNHRYPFCGVIRPEDWRGTTITQAVVWHTNKLMLENMCPEEFQGLSLYFDNQDGPLLAVTPPSHGIH